VLPNQIQKETLGSDTRRIRELRIRSPRSLPPTSLPKRSEMDDSHLVVLAREALVAIESRLSLGEPTAAAVTRVVTAVFGMGSDDIVRAVLAIIDGPTTAACAAGAVDAGTGQTAD
jgi:hypothetical protein